MVLFPDLNILHVSFLQEIYITYILVNMNTSCEEILNSEAMRSLCTYYYPVLMVRVRCLRIIALPEGAAPRKVRIIALPEGAAPHNPWQSFTSSRYPRTRCGGNIKTVATISILVGY